MRLGHDVDPVCGYFLGVEKVPRLLRGASEFRSDLQLAGNSLQILTKARKPSHSLGIEGGSSMFALEKAEGLRFHAINSADACPFSIVP